MHSKFAIVLICRPLGLGLLRISPVMLRQFRVKPKERYELCDGTKDNLNLTLGIEFGCAYDKEKTRSTDPYGYILPSRRRRPGGSSSSSSRSSLPPPRSSTSPLASSASASAAAAAAALSPVSTGSKELFKWTAGDGGIHMQPLSTSLHDYGEGGFMIQLPESDAKGVRQHLLQLLFPNGGTGVGGYLDEYTRIVQLSFMAVAPTQVDVFTWCEFRMVHPFHCMLPLCSCLHSCPTQLCKHACAHEWTHAGDFASGRLSSKVHD